jgi:hypothetical protein
MTRAIDNRGSYELALNIHLCGLQHAIFFAFSSRSFMFMSQDTFLFTCRCAIRSIDTSRAWNALRLVNLLSDERRGAERFRQRKL